MTHRNHGTAGDLLLRAKHLLSGDYLVDWNGAALTRVYDTAGPLSATFELESQRFRVAVDLANGSSANVLKTLFMGIAGKRKYALFSGTGATLSRAQALGIGTPGYSLVLSEQMATMDWDAQNHRFVVTMAGETCAALWKSKTSSRCIEGKLSVALAPADRVLLGLLAMDRWETVSRGN